jgi:hypothetical protein
MLRCSFCGSDLTYVHGHAACVSTECPIRGLSQADCCTGEDALCAVHVVPRTPMADPRTSGIWKRAESGEGDALDVERVEPIRRSA